MDDIGLLLEDGRKIVGGGSIQYAIDSSEIVSYAGIWSRPGRVSGDVSLWLFHDDQAEYTTKLNWAVSDFLFYGFGARFLLFQEYAEELDDNIRRYVEQQANRDIRGVAHAVGEMQRRLEYVVTKRDRERIESIGRQLLQVRQMSDVQIQSALETLTEIAPTLVDLLTQDRGEIRERLKAILDAPILAGIREIQADYPGLTEQAFEKAQRPQVEAEWLSALATSRGRGGGAGGANERDARVMMQLEAVDRSLERSNSGARLITRSEAMHRIQRSMKGAQDDSDRRMLVRHPRVFLLLGANQLKLNDRHGWATVVKEADWLCQSMQKFIDDAQDLLVTESRRTGPGAYVNRTLESVEAQFNIVKSDWHRLIDRIVVRGVTERPGSRQKTIELIANVVRSLNDPRSLRGELQKPIDNVLQRLPLLYLISQLTARTPFDVMKIFDQAVEFEIDRRRRALPDSIPTFMSFYRLHFQEPRFRLWFDRTYEAQQLSINELMQFLGEAMVGVAAIERLQAVAYFYATQDQWKTASDWIELAKRLSLLEDISRPDTFLLEALCLRCEPFPSSDHYAQLFFQGMRAVRQGLRATGSVADPRLLTERAAQVFHWALNAVPDAVERIPEAQRDGDEVIGLLDGHRDRESLSLRAKISNDRCYFYINSLDSDKGKSGYLIRTRADESLGSLKKALADLNVPESEWPTNWADTIYWAEWLLQSPPRERDSAVARFEQLLRRARTRRAQSAIGRHLEFVRALPTSDSAVAP